uniref:ORF16 n=1 Tax=Nitrosopumilaceae spindle-shaped virus TaxID=3065433 RepID=A0AAT9J9B3_9VIRU
MMEISMKGVAMQQVVNDGQYHTCMICLKFMDKDCDVVEDHIMKTHTRILALIAEEQKSDD